MTNFAQLCVRGGQPTTRGLHATREQFLGPDRPTEEKIIWMYIMCTFATVVGIARDKNHNSFFVSGGKKRLPTAAYVCCCKEIKCLKT